VHFSVAVVVVLMRTQGKDFSVREKSKMGLVVLAVMRRLAISQSVASQVLRAGFLLFTHMLPDDEWIQK